MKFNRDIQRLLKTESNHRRAVGVINTKVQQVCDFEIHLDNVPGDGWCFGAEVWGRPLYMKMEEVLEVVEKTGRFTKEDWSPFN